MIQQPLVTIIGLCYNHAPFLEEALLSVLTQDYSPIEIIVVDDCSTDKSAMLLRQFAAQYPALTVLFHSENKGNCTTFNEALALATGDFIIDFATDDVMPQGRLRKQLAFFEAQKPEIGVVYTNVALINREGKFLKTYYATDAVLPQGNVFEALLRNSFIMPSSMMIRKGVFDELQGYDARLAYEDFDFWIRSARTWQYAYLPEVLMKQRVFAGSYSTRFTQRKNNLVPTTVNVCQKAVSLIRTETEKNALISRLKRVMRQCFLTENTDALQKANALLIKLGYNHPLCDIGIFISQKNVPIHAFYRVYLAAKSLLK